MTEIFPICLPLARARVKPNGGVGNDEAQGIGEGKHLKYEALTNQPTAR